MMAAQGEIQLSDNKAADKFVAFIDLLGFSSRVLAKYDSSIEFYQNVLQSAGIIPSLRPDVKVTVYSDSFLLVSDALAPLVGATQALLTQTLFNDCLVRGGIAHGKHLEVHQGDNLYVVSEALVKAAAVEKNIKHPCVALHREVEVPDAWWLDGRRSLEKGLLYFGGIRLVNPCNIGWGQSAALRVMQMREGDPEHRDKFDWFLELHKAIFSPAPMVPPLMIVEAQ